jgi:hypothetical protein
MPVEIAPAAKAAVRTKSRREIEVKSESALFMAMAPWATAEWRIKNYFSANTLQI